MIFNILDNTTELWMTKYIIGEIFSSGGATLYKNPSDQTVPGKVSAHTLNLYGLNVLIKDSFPKSMPQCGPKNLKVLQTQKSQSIV